jgi:DivIVA domain-containing protein
MTFIFMLAAIVVITVIALLAVGKLGELPDVEPDRAPLALPTDRVLTDQDVDAVRFSVGARGYRMDEVDVVLDRLAAEVSERDARIVELESKLSASQPSGLPQANDSEPGPRSEWQ